MTTSGLPPRPSWPGCRTAACHATAGGPPSRWRGSSAGWISACSRDRGPAAPRSGRGDPGLPQVKELRLAHVELAHLLHLRSELRRRLLALAFPGVLFRGEVEGHGVGAALVPDPDAAEDLRPERGPLLRVLRHDLPGPVRIAAPALHDLDEAGLVRVTLQVGGDVVAVGEADLPGEQLGRLRPPLALLRPLAVAPGRGRRLDRGQPDELAVVGPPRGRAEPARRPRRQLLLPALERGVDLLRVADLATDHLNKHDDSPNSLA